jgi:HPt (histidine-containing phosphotransfer) domain-containing protein
VEQQYITYRERIKDHLSSAYLLSDEKIETVMPRFIGTIRKLMTELEQLAVTDNNDALSRTGHAIKGALLNLGLPELAEKAYSIENHMQVCHINGDRSKLVNELKKELDKIL